MTRYHRPHGLGGLVANAINRASVKKSNPKTWPSQWNWILWGNTNPVQNCALYWGVDVTLAMHLVHYYRHPDVELDLIKSDDPTQAAVRAHFVGHHDASMDLFDIANRGKRAWFDP